jgi:predicted nucleic acid-binding protein
VSAVSNTGPLIALAKVDSLPLLQTLFGEVEIPPAVHHELLAKSGAEAQHLDEAFRSYIRAADIPPMPPKVEQITRSLGAGEQQAFASAHTNDARMPIVERLGRNAARSLGVAGIGTAGVLVQTKSGRARSACGFREGSGLWASWEL